MFRRFDQKPLWELLLRAVGAAITIHYLVGAAHAEDSKQIARRIQEGKSASEVLAPRSLARVLNEREVVSYAVLQDKPSDPSKGKGSKAESKTKSDLKEYQFYGSALIRAPQAFVEKTVTNYKIYPDMISYIDKISMDPRTQLVKVMGGIWSWKMISFIRFTRKSVAQTSFEVIRGDFRGMKGDFFFDDQGPKGTVVLCRGYLEGSVWPPKFVMERGAEMALSYVAGRMRSYTEKQKSAATAPKGKAAGPSPRRSLGPIRR